MLSTQEYMKKSHYSSIQVQYRLFWPEQCFTASVQTLDPLVDSNKKAPNAIFQVTFNFECKWYQLCHYPPAAPKVKVRYDHVITIAMPNLPVRYTSNMHDFFASFYCTLILGHHARDSCVAIPQASTFP